MNIFVVNSAVVLETDLLGGSAAWNRTNWGMCHICIRHTEQGCCRCLRRGPLRTTQWDTFKIRVSSGKVTNADMFFCPSTASKATSCSLWFHWLISVSSTWENQSKSRSPRRVASSPLPSPPSVTWHQPRVLCRFNPPIEVFYFEGQLSLCQWCCDGGGGVYRRHLLHSSVTVCRGASASSLLDSSPRT